ncbi:MAG: hypothetical protein WA160_05710 [Pseudobdellovibrio sp.]
MSQPKFRHPKEMNSRMERVPLSTRVLSTTKDALEKAAKENGLSLAEISSNVLDDYASWLNESGKKKIK